ncbi:hypothetical protein [Lacinutrix sp. MEBiC02404]
MRNLLILALLVSTSVIAQELFNPEIREDALYKSVFFANVKKQDLDINS